MLRDIFVNVGIITDGPPRILPDSQPGITRVGNVVIGRDFHWQRQLECRYAGEMLLNPDESDPHKLINRIPLETYLEAVVGSEMNPAAPPEFLRAHAIISRSWVAGKILGSHSERSIPSMQIKQIYPCGSRPGIKLRSSEAPIIYDSSDACSAKPVFEIIYWEDTADHSSFHVCSDDHCQRYQGVQPLSDEAREALRATEGLVIIDKGGKIVDARFSKCCGGATELFSTCWQDNEMECLVDKVDPWCDLSEMPTARRSALLAGVLKEYDLSSDGGFRWTIDIAASDIQKWITEKFNTDLGAIIDIKAIQRGPSGRIRLLRIDGEKGILYLGKELMIRRALSPSHLYSSAFNIEKIDNADPKNPGLPGFRLHGKGWGHGVGLCQIGAARMALEGYSFSNILDFYYPGSRLAHIRTLFR